LKSRLPLKLEYYEACDSKKAAKEKEKFFKSGGGRKYINGKIGA